MTPTEIRLAKDRKSLILCWPDNKTETFSADLLRTGSQSAVSKRRHIDGTDTVVSGDLTITDIQPMGSYAINIVFSDGYDRGIFPWKFLRTLNERASAPERHSETDDQSLQNAQKQIMEV